MGRKKKRVQLECPQCGKHFELLPSVYRSYLRRSKNGKIHCSKKCGIKSYSENCQEHLVCDFCGKNFSLLKSKHKRYLARNKSDRLYCSRKCAAKKNCGHDKFGKGRCSDCGSTDIEYKAFRTSKRTLCYSCNRKRILSNRKKDRKTIPCTICGETKARRRHVDSKKYICRKCGHRGGRAINIKRFKFCEYCGRLFLGKDMDQRYCSVRCRYSDEKIRSEYCSGCGVFLDSETKTHAHKSHKRCDVCEYLARRNYKDKAKYGRENMALIQRLNIIDFIADQQNFLTGRGKKLCGMTNRKKEKILKRSIESLKLKP